MTTTQAHKMAAAMLAGPHSTVSADDSELVLVSKLQKNLACELARFFGELERKVCDDETARQCEGQSARKISKILGGKLATVKPIQVIP